MTGVTHDSISLRGAGILTIAQPRQGHRFTLDSILLADFCRIRPRERVLEPGAGTGIISLLLAKKHPRAAFTALEIQKDLCLLCEQNRNENALENLVTVSGNLRRPRCLAGEVPFDVIVANPPYVQTGRGREAPVKSRMTARQDRQGSLASWLNLHRLLKQGGRYNLVFPAARLAELLALLRRKRLEPKRVRLVHPFREKAASLVLVEAVKDGGAGLEVLTPLIVHEPGGAYSREMRELYGMR